MAASKKWRRSIKIDAGGSESYLSLGRWLDMQGCPANLKGEPPACGHHEKEDRQQALHRQHSSLRRQASADEPTRDSSNESETRPASLSLSQGAYSDGGPDGGLESAGPEVKLDPEIVAAASALELLRQGGWVTGFLEL